MGELMETVAEQAAEIQRVAAEENVIVGTRTTNPDTTRWIESGEAVPKPVDIEAKTINGLDARIEGPPTTQTGKVGFFEPVERSVPRQSAPELWTRYDQRAEEWAKLGGDMGALRDAGVVEVQEGIVNATQGMQPGTREFNRTFDRAAESATRLGEKLDRNHLSGAEQVVWTHREGSFVGARRSPG